MTRRTLFLGAGSAAVGAALLASVGTARPALAAPSFGKVTAVQTPRGHVVRDASLADVDGDGRLDLVVSARRAGRREGRVLRVHLRRDGEAAFDPEPDASLDVPDDVVAYGVADLDPEPGAEVALFTATGVWIWRTKADDDRRLARLLDADFLWQVAEPREVFAWDGSFRDVDGDGLTDLVLPEPEGYRIALQRPTGPDGKRFALRSVLRVPEDMSGDDAEPRGARRMRAKSERKRIKIAIQFGSDGSDVPGDLLSVTEAVPAPQVLDFDGDKRPDVVAQTPHQLHVWRQRADGTFGEAPDSSVDLPVAADTGRRYDVSYSAHLADLDRDGRSDCIVFGSAPGGDDPRTQILTYLQPRPTAAAPAPPMFGTERRPSQVLVLAGIAGSARLVDVDGDGAADLVTGAVRVDALDALAAAAKGSLDAEVYVFRNLGGKFAAEPSMRLGLSVLGEALRRGREHLAARFIPDVTGDGVRDLLLRDEPTRLRLLYVRRTDDGFAPQERALFETRLDEDARLVFTEGKSPEVLVIEDAQVRHLRFR